MVVLVQLQTLHSVVGGEAVFFELLENVALDGEAAEGVGPALAVGTVGHAAAV